MYAFQMSCRFENAFWLVKEQSRLFLKSSAATP
jgi:hypothetical protein